MRAALFILLGLCVFAIATFGQKPLAIVPEGLHKGETFLDLNEADKMTYSEGLIDGLLGSALFGASNEAVHVLKDCVKDMDSKQWAAILTKFIKDNPERWQQPMPILAFDAIKGFCPDLKTIKWAP